MAKSNENIFEIVDVTDEQVVVGVNAKDALTVAKHPYVSREYAYIVVTRGDRHTLAVIEEDGTRAVSFSWGIGGFDLVCDNLERLREKVCSFIEENGISLRGGGGMDEPIEFPLPVSWARR